VVINALLIFFASQILAAFLVQIGLQLIGRQRAVQIDQSVVGQFFYVLLAEALAAGMVIYIIRLRRLELSTDRPGPPTEILRLKKGISRLFSFLRNINYCRRRLKFVLSRLK
jgi:hypothetical protein